MKYKVGDRVRIKSLDWYNENKDEDGNVSCGEFRFVSPMSKFCGKILTIDIDFEDETYLMKEDNDCFVFTNEMIEGLVEDETKNNNDMEEKEMLLGWVKESDNLRLVPHKDYEIKHDGDNFYLVKKKKEFPKTYEECCGIIGFCPDTLKWDNPFRINRDTHPYIKHLDNLIESFRKLLICRDAYWKIAGEEMKLWRHWEPVWASGTQKKYCIYIHMNEVNKGAGYVTNVTLAFPTEEMRDAFYENFKKEIEICKEFL